MLCLCLAVSLSRVHLSYCLRILFLCKTQSLELFLLWLTYRWPLQPLLYYFRPRWVDAERKRAIAKGNRGSNGEVEQGSFVPEFMCPARHGARESQSLHVSRLCHILCIWIHKVTLCLYSAAICYLSAAMSCHRLPRTSRISHLFESVLTFSFTRRLSCQRSNEHKFSAMRSVASAWEKKRKIINSPQKRSDSLFFGWQVGFPKKHPFIVVVAITWRRDNSLRGISLRFWDARNIRTCFVQILIVWQGPDQCHILSKAYKNVFVCLVLDSSLQTIHHKSCIWLQAWSPFKSKLVVFLCFK